MAQSAFFCATYEPDTYAQHMYHEASAYMHARMRIYAGASWSYVRSTYESGDSATWDKSRSDLWMR